MKPLITFDRVSFTYPRGEEQAAPALSDLSLEIGEGEFVAVVGANGSGKSTFARLANALLIPQSGMVRVAGLDTRDPPNRARIYATIGMVFQFPEDQIISTTVEEDAAFGPENLGLPPAEIRARVEEALRSVGLWEYRRRPPHMLSAGQVQRLALAGVLAMRPRCVLFDEASTMLDPSGRRALIASMRRLHSEGVTVIFITHFMEEAALAERVIVFDRGSIAMDAPPAQIFASAGRLAELRLELPHPMRAAAVLRPLISDIPAGLTTLADLMESLSAYQGRGSAPSFDHVKQSFPFQQDSPALIEVTGLGHTYLRGTPLQQRALDGADLRVISGQAHGLLGMTGSGKSTLLQHLNGLLRPQEGSVRVGPYSLNDLQLDRREVIRQVGLVFQNPEAQFFEHYVGDEIAFGPIQLGVEGQRDPKDLAPVAERVRWAMDQVGLDFGEFKDRPLFALSGGERRKVALASTLALRPSILLLDEPTAGLDPRSRSDLVARLDQMRRTGITLVLSSHQMEDMAVLADALTVFQRGSDVINGPTAHVFSRTDLLSEHGMEAPVAFQIADRLRVLGWPIPKSVMTIEDLKASVAAARQEQPL